jgi:hypothetical protein
MAGVTVDVCLAFAAMQAVDAGDNGSAVVTSYACRINRPRRLCMRRLLNAWPPELFSDQG